MVFFALTQQGLESYLALQRFDYPLWLAGGIADEEMHMHMQTLGIAVSTFVDMIDPMDHERIECALETIREHHPTHSIWVDASVQSPQ